MTLDDLCSPGYRALLHAMAEQNAWAGGGVKYLNDIKRLCLKTNARSVLDYGCGNVDMVKLLPKIDGRVLRVQSFDPGIPGRERLPKPADVVVCVDVLEHVEPDKLDAVLRHIYSLTLKRAIIYIATRPAEKRLPDGRNAHLIIDNASWWIHRLRALGDWKGYVAQNDLKGLYMWWRT